MMVDTWELTDEHCPHCGGPVEVRLVDEQTTTETFRCTECGHEWDEP